ncbi:zinc ABC transporter substrate-binding protein AztC [soil metagenome]
MRLVLFLNRLILILNLGTELRRMSNGKVDMHRAFIILIAVLVAACGSNAITSTTPASPTDTTPTSTPEETSEPDTTDLVILASTSILGDVVKQTVGDTATVEVLMGPGVDPHDFQVSAAQAALFRTADLVVINGLNLEEGILDVIASAEAEGANILSLGELVDPIPFGGDHDHDEADHDDDEADHDEDGHGHAHGDEDPHFWFDPRRMANAVDLIAAEVASLMGGSSADVSERAAEYKAEVLAMDESIEATLSSIPSERRKLVTTHDNLGYLAARYDFEVVGTVIPGGSTLAQPSSGDLAQLVTTLEREGVRAIFTESFAPDSLAQAVADELGESVTVHELYTDALGEPGSGADTYLGLMETTAATIAGALR